MTDKDYKKGFNHGYLIAQNGLQIPLIEISKGNIATQEYYKGLKDGVKEFRKELILIKNEESREKNERDR